MQGRVLQIGEHVEYYSRSTGQWVPAVVQGHNTGPKPQGGSQLVSYKLDVQPAAELDRVKSRSESRRSSACGDQLLPAGELVWYCSQSSGQWVPAVVQGHAKNAAGELVYVLDRKPDAELSRVIKRDEGSSAPPNWTPAAGDPPYSHAQHACAGQPTMSRQPSFSPQGASCQVRNGGQVQSGYGPEMWGVSMEQLEAILEDPRFTGGFWSRMASSPKKLTFRQVVEQIVRPDTDGKGIGYAMLKNAGQPLHAKVIVCHSWEDDYREFVTALQSTSEKGPFWLCAMAMYQGDAAGGHMGPLAESFMAALQKAESMICIVIPESTLYTRLWCLFQISSAVMHGVPVTASKRKGKAWSMCTDPLLEHCKEPVQSREAECGPKTDQVNPEAQLLKSLVDGSPGSFEGCDRRVEESRLHILEKRRARLTGGAWKNTEFCRAYDDVIDIVRCRLGLPPATPAPQAPQMQMPHSAPVSQASHQANPNRMPYSAALPQAPQQANPNRLPYSTALPQTPQQAAQMQMPYSAPVSHATQQASMAAPSGEEPFGIYKAKLDSGQDVLINVVPDGEGLIATCSEPPIRFNCTVQEGVIYMPSDGPLKGVHGRLRNGIILWSNNHTWVKQQAGNRSATPRQHSASARTDSYSPRTATATMPTSIVGSRQPEQRSLSREGTGGSLKTPPISAAAARQRSSTPPPLRPESASMQASHGAWSRAATDSLLDETANAMTVMAAAQNVMANHGSFRPSSLLDATQNAMTMHAAQQYNQYSYEANAAVPPHMARHDQYGSTMAEYDVPPTDLRRQYY